jgi:hypothetical protein
MLERAAHRARRAARGVSASSSDHDLHRLRLAAKRALHRRVGATGR